MSIGIYARGRSRPLSRARILALEPAPNSTISPSVPLSSLQAERRESRWPRPALHACGQRLRCCCCSCVLSEPDARELPARGRRKEVAIARADVSRRRRRGTAAQHQLAAHELAVVFGGGAV